MPTCPRCGAELGPDDPAALCPACLIQGALWSASSDDEFTADTVAPSPPGQEDDFGRYHVIRLLGEGGMGSVYLAEQREPIRRRVALKVVKSGMDSGQVLARFDNERQALALMDHPSIAQIFDAGATSKGRPYFVMEFIDGLPITQYCDRNRMPTRERLWLFLAVCRAVQHAHQKGVIHRDLKPSNVLVIGQDGQAIPKVIDFGIAKATDKWAVEKTLLTQFGQVIGTPEYASPEQADSMTGDVDQSSDVYSLGVVLYELLIGAVPFDSATLRSAGLAEMLRIIREEEAPSLSRKLTSMGAAVSGVAEHRRTDPVTLRRIVDGDLNWITTKALEKARTQRYASVSDLAADIQRHLEHRPVLASPPGTLYRARKLLRRHRQAALGATAGLVLVVLAGVTAWSLARRDSVAKPTLTDKDTIVLADFDNKTGDPVFDDTLRAGLSVELQESPFLGLISDRQVQQQLALMGQPKDARLTPDVAQQICERTASAIVMEGSIASLGNQYVLGLRARDCNTGDTVDQRQVQVAKREDVLNALSELGRGFRSRVGESTTTVQRSKPLFEATTHSLEALKAYSNGLKAALTAGNTAAVPYLRRAVEFDPEFAMAYAQLGLSYSADGESVLAAQNTARAWQLRDRVSDRERFFIDFSYDRQVTGNLERAYQTLELWRQTYPRGSQPTPQGLLGGLATHGTGRFERVIEASKESLAADPDIALSYSMLASGNFFTDRFAESLSALDRASNRKLDIPDFLVLRYNIAVLQGDQQEMDRAVGLARGKRRAEHWLAHEQALALARSGRLREAAHASNRAIELAVQEGAQEEAASYRAARATWEAIYGDAGEARKHAAAALEASNGRDVEYAAGLAVGLAGDASRSQQLADDLERRFPEDTFARFTYVPVLRALSSLGRGEPADSLERLQMAVPYELAANGLNFNHFYLGGLHSAYVRGEALLAARQYREAAAEFQKILDHRGLVGADPIGALAHVQLGRVFALSGNAARAREAYQAFLALWKDADPDIPLLKSARAEYDRLS
jgi:eukaryotic-like serine/threonine-protein kinase